MEDARTRLDVEKRRSSGFRLRYPLTTYALCAIVLASSFHLLPLSEFKGGDRYIAWLYTTAFVIWLGSLVVAAYRWGRLRTKHALEEFVGLLLLPIVFGLVIYVLLLIDP